MSALRLVLAALAVSALGVGVPATFAPGWFYDSFPGPTSWVSLLPAYNEHLVTDVGGLQLAFGLLLAWAAYRPERALVVPVCLAFSLSQALHFGFHAGNLDAFGTADAIAQQLALAFVALVPLLAVRLALVPNRRI